MAIPDPYINTKFLLVHLYGDLEEDLPLNHCSSDVNVNAKYALYNGLPATAPMEAECHKDIESIYDWDDLIVSIEQLYKTHKCVIVGSHLKGVLMRAAWWWHLRTKRPEPGFSNGARVLDIVDTFNGPAIMTAEDRYNFRIYKALEILELGNASSGIMPGMWSLSKRLLEYKL